MPIQNILPLFLSISWFQTPFLTTAPFLFLFSFLLHSLQSWKKVFFFFLFALTLSLCFSFFLVFGLLSFYKYISYHLPLSLVSLSLFLPSFTTPLKTRSFFYLTLLLFLRYWKQFFHLSFRHFWSTFPFRFTFCSWGASALPPLCTFLLFNTFSFSSGKKENQILFRLSKRRRTIVWLRFQSQSESDTKTQNCYKKVILKKKKFLFERPTPTFSKKSF